MEPAPADQLRFLLSYCMRWDRLRIAAELDRLARVGPEAARAHLERLFAQAHASNEIYEGRARIVDNLNYPPELPISQKREEILEKIRNHQVVIVVGETGSGKTTQIPKMCLEAGLGIGAKIGCTQPRRVAALSISRRIAEELNTPFGREVGCKIRFSDQTSRETCVKIMTDGILLAETQADPNLEEYDCIIIDEAHERTLNIDFLLGYLKLLLAKRPDLKLIITSATIDTKGFSEAFDGAPVVEVSGRLFPVELRYAPVDDDLMENGDLTYIDLAGNVVDAVIDESHRGDILIFMPGERDILETRDLLEGRLGGSVEIIPLFGRLSAAEQQRVFAPSSRRKVIISTNIAETSLTIPGIRYVVDAGLARLSRYNHRTRTRRLPIEPISQSSANQRMGRSGRVENGVCVRLYSEEDFQARPAFTQPEIQRSNLAEVILRMKAYHLGQIETFPFLNPPSPQAIGNGYQLLQELGALDNNRDLTPLGKDLAQLPIDPTIGRMLLQSRQEGALRELLIIASGLSIQDPRERPTDAKEAADRAHKRFQDPQSDFLTLLNIWNAWHDLWETLKTQNQMRKFCKSHFLSYLRMREWIDIHKQISEALRDIGDDDARRRAPDRPPEEDRQLLHRRVHRCILTGLLGHVAQREEKNVYKASGNRQLMVFPGSALFEQGAAAKAKNKEEEKKPSPSRQPHWIVAGEIVETSRLFARTIAGIDPAWIVELGAHVCQFSYFAPFWSAKAGRVLVEEKIRLHGLEVASRDVAFANINPTEATEIFIRSALVEDDLPINPRFMQHNRAIRQKIETWQTRMRHHEMRDLDQACFDFYARHIENVSSVHDLNRFLKERLPMNPDFLCVVETDLTGGKELSFDTGAFPEEVQIGNEGVTLQYAYAPGEDHDGVTVRLPVRLVHGIPVGALDAIVPGYLEEQLGYLLKGLPKSLRVQLVPLPQKVKEIAAEIAGRRQPLLESLTECVRRKYKVEIPVAAWDITALPNHLRPRIEVTGDNQKPVAASRDLGELQRQIKVKQTPTDTTDWSKALQRWEKHHLGGWTVGDLPPQIELGKISSIPVFAYPGFKAEGLDVSLRLFKKPEEALEASRAGIQRLGELALGKELAWVQKDLRSLAAVKAFYITLGPVEELAENAYENIKRDLFKLGGAVPLSEKQFQAIVEAARARLPGLVPKFVDSVSEILRLRQQLLVYPKPFPGMLEELNGLIPKQFLLKTPFSQLPHFPRYLKALLVRAERAALNPAKDREKARLVQPYQAALPKVAADRREEFRWMLEELKVSVFAQELGTACPVSPARLNRFLETPSKV